MPQEWEYGNAARQPAYDESTHQNPFAPIDYAAGLQDAGPQPGPMYAAPLYDQNGYPLNGGQDWYGAQGYPMADYGVPEYGAQYDQYPAQNAPGAPYTASMFAHQPTAVVPSGWQADPFNVQSAVRPWLDAPTPPAPVWAEEEPQNEPQPVYYAAADIPLRDAFTPAAPREKEQQTRETAPAEPEQKQKKRRPVRPARLLALIAAGIMLAICAVVGGGLIAELMRSEEDAAAFRAAYQEENGVDFYAGVAKVDLLPEGEEYPSTPTPEPTLFVPTPKPTPIIPIGKDFRGGEVDASAAEETPEPALRTRITNYPANPMRNITESLRTMIEENPEVVGRLVIDGVLDEMVMQRNNTHYLTHDSTGATSDSGAVFADQSCTFRLPPENLLLRGSSFVPGKVFEPLWQFVSGGSQFVANHMFARLTGLYEDEVYVLFAVLVADINPAGSRYFNYASNPTFTTDEAMMAYVESARASSLYNFTVDVTAGDRLLTLATVSNGDTNLVLMYRMVRQNETMGR